MPLRRLNSCSVAKLIHSGQSARVPAASLPPLPSRLCKLSSPAPPAPCMVSPAHVLVVVIPPALIGRPTPQTERAGEFENLDHGVVRIESTAGAVGSPMQDSREKGIRLRNEA